jgi:hypothetical protein
MTCVWDSIIAGIPRENFISAEFSKNKKKQIKPDMFVQYLIQNNTKTENITINKEKIPEKIINENFEMVKDFKIKSIRNGYLCSTYDPFLALVCEVFVCSLFNNFNGTYIKYEHVNPKFIIYISNDEGHMVYVKTDELCKNIKNKKYIKNIKTKKIKK